MTKQFIQLDGFSTKEIALVQKPINEVLKESEGVIISFNKTSVKKNLNALVKKHEKEITELIAFEVLTGKQESRLRELRKLYGDSRIALDKITKHNSSVLAQASKSSKVVKEELTLIVEPIEDKITARLEKESTRREKAAEEKLQKEEERKKKHNDFIDTVKGDLQKVISEDFEFDQIENQTKKFNSIVEHALQMEVDLEEFQVVYEAMITDMEEEFDLKIKGIQNAYNLGLQTKALEVEKLTNSRMSELFDFNFKYKAETPLGKLTDEEYSELLLKVILDFRVKEITDLGITLSADKTELAYIPTDSIILIKVTMKEIEMMDSEAFEEFKNNSISEIENYNNPPKDVENIDVIEEEIAKETKETETVTEDVETKKDELIYSVDSASGNDVQKTSYFLKTNGKIEEVDAPINFKTEEQNKGWTALEHLRQNIMVIDAEAVETSYLIELIEKLKVIERENIINAYNDGQTSTINIVLEEIKKEAPEFGTEMKDIFDSNVNKLDSIEYFNNKFDGFEIE